jgi:pilus assembly protein CpaF
MSFELILPFFPEELRGLLQDPSISDLMINGTTGVYADRNGVVQHIPLAVAYTIDRFDEGIVGLDCLFGFFFRW